MRYLRAPLLGAVLLGVGALIASACGGGSGGGSSGGEPARDATPAAARPADGDDLDGVLRIASVPTLKFDKDELRAKSGVDLTVAFRNDDTGQPHNWALYHDEDHSHNIVGANKKICTAPCEEQVSVGPLDAGTYYFRCDVHPDMVGRLIVQ